ncbi:hypothetical protein ACOI1C_12710 [Bacillus sp. DJP31]|uniref:hypothetical protein n=1 Tax=Bacillus sp. DJP31 TaxID=3409789 RepID=UPI003BB7E43C
MRIKLILLLFLFSIVLIGCQSNSLNLNEDVTKVEVYNWEDKKQIKSFEDTSLINSLVTKLNKAHGEKMSDTSDIAAPTYKIIFKNKEETMMRLGLSQSESEAYFTELDSEIMYIIDLALLIG